jgi:hypothetical protein
MGVSRSVLESLCLRPSAVVGRFLLRGPELRGNVNLRSEIRA